MNFGVKDLFMGVVHLFVIFLPGSLLLTTLLFAFPAASDVIEPLNVTEVGRSLIFIGVSYFLGHLVSLLASALEDRIWTRPWLKDDQRRHDSDLKIWQEGGTPLRQEAVRIAKHFVPAELVTNGNARRWSQALVRHKDSVFRTDIDNKDADRRFFRNIRLVLPAPLTVSIFAWWQEDTHWAVMAGLLSITALAWLRYIDQDRKFTKLVFESLVVIEQGPPKQVAGDKAT